MSILVRTLMALCALAVLAVPSAAQSGDTPQQKPAEQKIDVTGTWLFEVTSDVSSGTRTVTFKQDGESLTGKYTGTYGDADLTGTIKGASIAFWFEINAEGASVRVNYAGTVEKDTMKGTLTIGDMGDGTFTAKRK